MKKNIETDILNALKRLNINFEDEINVEIPKNKENGDYSSNIAMRLTKLLGKNPKLIAEEIIDNIERDNYEDISIANPGFINFIVKKDYLFENILKVLKEKEDYGKSDKFKGITLNLEFVSANPTGILHLGHARGAACGDSLARVLKFAGYDVTKEYYINDAGNQMNNLGISIQTRYLNLLGKEQEMPEGGYHGKEIITIAKKLQEEYNDTAKDKDIKFFKEYGLKILLDQIKEDLSKVDVNFDVWSSETAIYEEGYVDKTLNLLKETGKTYTSEGALFLKTTDYGDEKDRVLIKQDGNNTYLLPDIAYHINKYSRGYDTLIDILGADHHGYVARLKASLQILGYDSEKVNVGILQMVRLIKDGQELKMSKRTGNAVTIMELFEEVGKDALRYFFVSHSLDSQMDFDLDVAVKKSNENPVYYINYAHARISSILNDNKNIDYSDIEEFTTINSESAYNMLTKLYIFQETVERAASKREAHHIANYVYELATAFHSYYAKEKIVTDDEKWTKERLLLISAVRITIKNALTLLGVDAYEKM